MFFIDHGVNIQIYIMEKIFNKKELYIKKMVF